MTLCINNTGYRQSLIFFCRNIIDIICCSSFICLIILCIIIIAKLCLEFKVLDNFPSECSRNIKVLTLLLTVVIFLCNDWIKQITEVIVRSTRGSPEKAVRLA